MIQSLNSKYGYHTGFVPGEDHAQQKKKRCKPALVIGLTIVFSMIALYIISTFLLNMYSGNLISDPEKYVLWSIINVSIGFKTKFYSLNEWPLIFVANMLLIVQLISHIPFIFFVGKE